MSSKISPQEGNENEFYLICSNCKCMVMKPNFGVFITKEVHVA